MHEPAHRWAFGFGTSPTWEWRPDVALRSHLLPAPLALAYSALRVLRLDAPFALSRLAPACVYGAFAAAADLAAGALADAHFGGGLRCEAGDWALAASLASWLNAYAGGRALPGAVEAPLCAWAAVLFGRRRAPAALGLAALAVAVRPTAALMLLPAWWHGDVAARGLRGALPPALLAAAAASAALCACESWLYGRYAFPPLAFLRFNLLSGGAAAFGLHAWHWYATSGVPQALFTLLPAVAARAADAPVALSTIFAVPLAALSLCGHKELRFVQAAMPPMLALAGESAKRWRRAWRPRAFAATATAVCLSQAALALYLGNAHQIGQATVVSRVLAPMAARGALPDGVHFLTACHSSPGMAAVHAADVPLRLLDCSPSVPWAESGPPAPPAPHAHEHEDARFFAAPLAYLCAEYGRPPALGRWLWRPHTPLPSAFVVPGGEVEDAVASWMAGAGYERCAVEFNAHLGVDSRERPGEIALYCRI